MMLSSVDSLPIAPKERSTLLWHLLVVTSDIMTIHTTDIASPSSPFRRQIFGDFVDLIYAILTA